jgi:hypothetical protein
VLSDLVQVFLVFLAVVNGHHEFLAAEPIRTPTPIDVGLWVAASLAIRQVQNRHIKVDDNFGFGIVDVHI